VSGIRLLLKGELKNMKKIFWCGILLFTINSCKAGNVESTPRDSDSLRLPVFAGQFYLAAR